MTARNLTRHAAALLLMAFAAVCLWRLLVGFPVTIAGLAIGQVATFFAFVICFGLSLALFFVARSEA